MSTAPAQATVETAEVASLVLDYAIYPRASVSQQNKARIGEALRAGVRLPHLVADRASRRITDGFHRHGALLDVFGPAATAEVEFREYASEAEMFLDAAAMNAAHGEPLSSYDKARCLVVAQRLGVPDDLVPQVLSLTAAKVEEMRQERFAFDQDGQQVLLKRSNRHLAGRRISPEQAEGNIRSSGQQLTYHMNQVINAFENGLANLDDPALLRTAGRLRAVLP